MLAFLFVILMFAYCWLIGLAALTLLELDLGDLRIALTAPVMGSSVIALITFLFSESGVSVGACAVPIAIVLALSALAALATRRPRIHIGSAVVAGACLIGALIVAWPMFTFAFHWFGDGNDDMTNYVLSAQDLLRRGLLAPVQFNELLHGRDYASLLASLHLEGSRPGSDLLLAFASAVLGHAPYELFMGLIVTFALCGACAVGALALQLTDRAYAAALAAAAILISPMATFGVVHQLLSQVWGLALAACLLALLLRKELHLAAPKKQRICAALTIGVLGAGLLLGYPELLPPVLGAYLAYVLILVWRKQIEPAAVALLWASAIAGAAILLNAYLPNEIHAFSQQLNHGLRGERYPPLFGYVLVPSALPGILGLQTLPPETGAPNLSLSIIVSVLAMGGLLLAIVAEAWKSSAAALALLVEGVLGLALAVKKANFGLFKLTMYVQPFLAALYADLMARVRVKRLGLVLCIGAVAVITAVEVSTQQAYVRGSQNPIDALEVSAPDVIPTFHAVASHSAVLVSVTANPFVAKLEAASAEGHPVFFLSRNVFAPFLVGFKDIETGGERREAERILRSGPWHKRAFTLNGGSDTKDPFEEDEQADRALETKSCELALPGPRSEPLNRYTFGRGAPNLVTMPCDDAHNVLAFVNSKLGEGFYLPAIDRNVSYFAPGPDPFYENESLSAFGQYALFQVLGYSPGERLMVDLTKTLIHDGVDKLPPASVLGASRVPLPLEGVGSARVISAPLTPEMIHGVPYLLLDMGEPGHLLPIDRSGVENLYGGSVPTDPRYLTVFVRDLSLMSAAQYRSLHPPLVLKGFPASLKNPDLEYSGVYEDGWIGSQAFVKLAGGAAGSLVIRGVVPEGAGKHLTVSINGVPLGSVAIAPGTLDVSLPVPASDVDRKVELRFAKTIHLEAPDLRPAAALLRFLGIVEDHPQKPSGGSARG